MPAKPARKRPAPAPRTARKAAPRRAPRVVPIAHPRTISLPFVVADTARSDQLLTLAIAGSILLHAFVLALKFSPFDLSALDRNGPLLEVALVNAKSKAKPTKAEILAQANLDGGGNTDADRRAKTPLPVLPRETVHRELGVATQRVEQLETRTRELMTQLRAAPAVPPPVSKATDAPDPADLPSSTELMQRTLEALRLEAQIAKEMEAYEKRPKRRFIGARAAEYRFARYVEDWRLKVERVGNLNYPEAARARKLYGSLLLTVGIRADGRLESIAVDRSSGQKILDLAATRIVRMASPYAPFPPDIKRDTDILYITRTWTFAPGDSLISQ
jgi:protein TonB